MGKGFVAVLPIETTEIYLFPEYISNIESDHMRHSFQSVNYFKTGVAFDLFEILLEYMKSEIELSEILSIIPFNVFVPELNQETKNFIIDNYKRIQDSFGIKSLVDWSNINPSNLAKVIIALGGSRILPEEEWNDICIKICEEAKKHAKAIS